MLEQLEQLRVLRSAHTTMPIDAANLAALKAWQQARLTQTYADLAADPRYAPATRFFLNELYGGHDNTWRDRDLLRMHGTIKRVLPKFAYQTITKALMLDVMSEQFDQAMARELGSVKISEARYRAAFRAVGQKQSRLNQVRVMREVGDALDVVVKKPMISSTLVVLRGPSKLAGLGDMQRFLEAGFSAFKHMNGADYFLSTIATRESALIEALFF